jgi:segregation and condensation protein B
MSDKPMEAEAEVLEESLEASAEVAEEESDELGAPSLAAALEALLIVAVEPLSAVSLAEATRHPVEVVEGELRRLAEDYTQAERGFALREVAGGWRYYTRDTCSGVIERFVIDGQQARLTQAALETLAVVAYRQPVSRARISAVRGVNVDGVLRTLQSRGLVEEAGTDPSSQAILYRTTPYFLERLGIASLEDLPDLSEYLPDLAELDAVLDSVHAGE